MTSYVYVLSHYGEYGLEAPITATTDREKVVDLFKSMYPALVQNYLPKLNEILSISDEDLCFRVETENIPSWWDSAEPFWKDGQHSITEGWAAVQLMVLKLEE